jgi:hypothetical protein
MSIHRIQVVVSREERARMKAQADALGLSLGEWLRALALAEVDFACECESCEGRMELDGFVLTTFEGRTPRAGGAPPGPRDQVEDDCPICRGLDLS